MADDRGATVGRTLVFGDLASRAAGFALACTFPSTPSTADGSFNFLLGASFLVLDGQRWELTGQNGIEAQALDVLRTDLRTMVAERSGGLYVQDHDSSLSVNLWVDGDVVLGWATSPGGDIWSPDMGDGQWDQPLAAMSFEQLDALASTIDEVEAIAGPLTGYCCRVLAPSWPSHDPRKDL